MVGSPDHELGQVPVAYIVLRGSEDDADIDLDLAAQVTARLRDHLAAALVRSKRPVSLTCRARDSRPGRRARCNGVPCARATPRSPTRLDCR